MVKEKKFSDIPDSVYYDNTIKSYKILDSEHVTRYYEREASPQDKPANIVKTELIDKPMFYGEWQDKTAEYLEALERKKELLKKEKSINRGAISAINRELNRPGTHRTKEDIIAEELAKARELLAELQLSK